MAAAKQNHLVEGNPAFTACPSPLSCMHLSACCADVHHCNPQLSVANVSTGSAMPPALKMAWLDFCSSSNTAPACLQDSAAAYRHTICSTTQVVFGKRLTCLPHLPAQHSTLINHAHQLTKNQLITGHRCCHSKDNIPNGCIPNGEGLPCQPLHIMTAPS